MKGSVYSSLNRSKKPTGVSDTSLAGPPIAEKAIGMTMITEAVRMTNCTTSVTSTAHSPPAAVYRTMISPMMIMQVSSEKGVATCTMRPTG